MTFRSLSLLLVLCLGIATLILASEACSGTKFKAANRSDTQANRPRAGSPVDDKGVQTDEDQTILAVSKAIKQAQLTDRADECLKYQFDATSFKDAYVIQVRESHEDPRCGGDRGTEPLLFTVRVDKRSGAMSTDIRSPGRFEPLH